MKEFEIKFIVGRTVFDRLLRQIVKDYPSARVTAKKQINYYYDTEGLDLYDKNITLRIRQSDDGFLLQEKIHTGNGIEADETEKPISALPFSMQYQGKTAILQGSLQTNRTSAQIDSGIKIEFDENWYLGNHDYEIEIEYDPAQEAKAKELCQSLSLCRPNDTGKSTRFFQARKEVRRNAAI